MRIYYRLGLLAQAYPQAQILLADNGLPDLDAQTLRRMNVVSLTYDRALLRDVQHPGEGAVETIVSAIMKFPSLRVDRVK